jgi:hypothetical protein
MAPPTPYPSSNNAAGGCAARDRHVPEALSVLDSRIASVLERWETLEGRLAVVVRNEPVASGAKEQSDAVVELAGVLRNDAARLAALEVRISSLLDRLEL